MFPPKYLKLLAMSDDELIEKYDTLAESTGVGLGFALDELVRRGQTRQTEAMLKQTDTMLKYTRYILWMTIVVTVATIVNVVIATILLAK